MRLSKRRASAVLLVVSIALLIAGTPAGPASAKPRRGVAVKSFRYLTGSHLRTPSRTRARTRTSTVEHPLPPPLIALPPVRQHSEAACGLASLQSVFAYYGTSSKRASQLVREAQQGRRTQRYTYETGTPEGMMVKLARDTGLKVESRKQMTLPELVRNLSAGKPVTVGIQAWVSHPERTDWREVQTAGHYLVAIGVGDAHGQPLTSTRGLAKRDDAYVWFMDPAADLGNRGYIPVKEFMQRWHWTGDNGKPSRFGMVLSSTKAPSQTSFVSGVERIQ